MRHRFRAVLAVALIAAVSPVVPATAARSATLTITAPRSGYVVRTFRPGVTLHLDQSRVTGGGTYTGFYFQPEGKAPERGLGAAWFAAFDEPGFKPIALPLGTQRPDAVGGRRVWPVPAGRYRIHVFGDRATEARLVFSGATATHATRVARPSLVAAAAREMAPPAAGQAAPRVLLDELPLAVRDNSVSFSAVFTTFRWLLLDNPSRWDTCITRADAARCAGLGPPSGGMRYQETHLNGVLSSSVAVGMYYYGPQTLGSGERVAYFDLASPALVERAAVAAFTISF